MYCSKCGARASELDRRCAQCGSLLAFPPVEPGSPGEGAPAGSPPEMLPPAAVATPARPPAVPLRSREQERLLYAGFWRRFATAVVDFIVLTPFSYAIHYAFGDDLFGMSSWSSDYWRVQALVLALTWLYCALLESSRWQGTLGQQLLGLRVCSLAGSRIGFGRATARHFAQILSVVTFGLGYLIIPFMPRKQALHDWVSGCLIVRPAPQSVEFIAPAPPGATLGAHS